MSKELCRYDQRKRLVVALVLAVSVSSSAVTRLSFSFRDGWTLEIITPKPYRFGEFLRQLS